MSEFSRGERFDPPLNYKELAFYDAVCAVGSTKRLMEGEVLAEIARALVRDVERNLSTDWLSRKPVRAKLRNRVHRLLAKFDYPPDQEKKAIEDVIRQMEKFAGTAAPTAGGRARAPRGGAGRPSGPAGRRSWPCPATTPAPV
ncbi:hypothetical protein FHS13_002524 [Nocardiopsis algeriensis]|uniref:Type I restriction enzyme HindI endonuclease subunit-like C-terminal domain-containing protein n=1 Tax=Nocardiopsis algeriensis TaxID=1478215 RepID=A0A841IPB0_9ACTN|nr:hypothetical protein [Nocardiopsis algeriensis]